MKVYGGCASDVGTTREVNQDAVLFRMKTEKKATMSLLAVCDGIGGMSHGEVASSIIRDLMDRWFDEITEWVDPGNVDAQLVWSNVKDAAESWNAELVAFKKNQQLQTGTTMSLFMQIMDEYFIVQVGDSRVYLYRNDELLQLTVDASVTRFKSGRMKNYLDNYMGKSDELRFTTVSGTIESGDAFLVCSDGFYHNLSPMDLQSIPEGIRKDSDVENLCERLIVEMMRRGERDNISAAMIVFPESRGFWKKQ